MKDWRWCKSAGFGVVVPGLLDVRDLVCVLEEDHSSPRSAQRLVGGGGHDVAVLERRRVLS